MGTDDDALWSRLAEICRKIPRATEHGDVPSVRAFRVGVNTEKVFAFLACDGASRGIHVRSDDAALLANPCFEPSRAYFLRGGRSNWLRLVPRDREPDWSEVERLVKKSHRLTLKPHEGAAFGCTRRSRCNEPRACRV